MFFLYNLTLIFCIHIPIKKFYVYFKKKNLNINLCVFHVFKYVQVKTLGKI